MAPIATLIVGVVALLSHLVSGSPAPGLKAHGFFGPLSDAPAYSRSPQIQERSYFGPDPKLEHELAVHRHDERLIWRWGLHRHPKTYAGLYYVPRRGGLLAVGFTKGQQAALRSLRRLPGLRERRRVVSFPRRPNYSLRMLERIEDRVWRISAVRRDSELIVETSIDIEGNVVEVGSERPKAARTLIAEAFSPGLPIRVVWGEVAEEI